MLDCASVDLALVQPSDARSDWSGMGKKERKKKRRKKEKNKWEKGRKRKGKKRRIRCEREDRGEDRGRIHDKLLASKWPLVKQPSGALLPSADSIPWDPACPFSEILRGRPVSVGTTQNILIKFTDRSDHCSILIA